MKVRVGKKLAAKLAWQHDYMGDGAGTVFARAMRKYRRLGEPELELYEESTYGGGVVTINAPNGWSADRIRALLWWHLAGVEDAPPARFVAPGVPGRDWGQEGSADFEDVPLDINYFMQKFDIK